MTISIWLLQYFVSVLLRLSHALNLRFVAFLYKNGLQVHHILRSVMSCLINYTVNIASLFIGIVYLSIYI